MGLSVYLTSAAIVATISVQNGNAHTYHLGECAVVEPQQGFDMEKFLGKWYAVQKTTTGSRCLTYTFSKTSEPNKFKVEQVSEHPVLGLVRENEYHYTGMLTIPNADTPARMRVNFPLSVAGTASYVVFMTDYDTYAGIYTCQKIAFGHRHSATILSRTKTLDRTYTDKLRNRLSLSNVNPYDLSFINQTYCTSSDLNININKDTFSPENIGEAVRKVGSKVGDGVEWVAGGVKTVYNKVKKDEDRNVKDVEDRVIYTSVKDPEEVLDNLNQREPSAEWL